jgi:GNAT superfamily N-acetyltransferase
MPHETPEGWYAETNLRANHTRYVIRKDFDCGLDVINRYYRLGLKRSLKSENVTGIGVFNTGLELVGFCTLALCSLHREAISQALPESNLPPQIPVLRLIMLGVDQHWQGRGIGRVLLKESFSQAIRVHHEVPLKGVYLDAAPDAVAFYRKLGFTALQDPDLSESIPMFIGIRLLKQAASA